MRPACGLGFLDPRHLAKRCSFSVCCMGSPKVPLLSAPLVGYRTQTDISTVGRHLSSARRTVHRGRRDHRADTTETSLTCHHRAPSLWGCVRAAPARAHAAKRTRTQPHRHRVAFAPRPLCHISIHLHKRGSAQVSAPLEKAPEPRARPLPLEWLATHQPVHSGSLDYNNQRGIPRGDAAGPPARLPAQRTCAHTPRGSHLTPSARRHSEDRGGRPCSYSSRGGRPPAARGRPARAASRRARAWVGWWAAPRRRCSLVALAEEEALPVLARAVAPLHRVEAALEERACRATGCGVRARGGGQGGLGRSPSALTTRKVWLPGGPKAQMFLVSVFSEPGKRNCAKLHCD